MKYQVLYYPKFEPDQRWLRSTLLFVDEIWRIIPSDVSHTDSRPTQELIQWMPDVFQTIVPNEEDKDVTDFNYRRLDLAFAKIRESRKERPKNRYVVTFDLEGHALPMQGDVWLAKSKANDEVFDLLFKHGLAFKIEHPNGNLIPVQEDAANLVVSYIADRIAARTSFDTITDCTIPHAVRSFDSIGITDRELNGSSDGFLISSGVLFFVPANVEKISPAAFQELRQTFSDIRPAFHNLMQCFAGKAKLNKQRTEAAFEIKLEAAIRDYQSEFEKYKKSAFAKKFDHWTPIAIQSFLALVSAISPELLRFCTASSIAIEIMKRQIEKNEEPIEHEKTFRMLCKLEKRINKLSDVADLI